MIVVNVLQSRKAPILFCLFSFGFPKDGTHGVPNNNQIAILLRAKPMPVTQNAALVEIG